MASEECMEKYHHFSLDSNASEPPTEIDEQCLVPGVDEFHSNQPGIDLAAVKRTSNVNGHESKDLGSKLEYQNRNLRNMDRQLSNGLPRNYGDAPLIKSVGEGMEVNYEMRDRKRAYFSSAGYHLHVIVNGIETEHFYPWDSDTGQYGRCRCPSHLSKSNRFSSMNGNGAGASHNSSSSSRIRSLQTPSSLRESSIHSQNFRQSHKDKECYPIMKSYQPHNRRQYGNASNGPRNNFRYTPRFNGNNGSEVAKEIVCGPSALGLDDSLYTNETDDDLPYLAQKKNTAMQSFKGNNDTEISKEIICGPRALGIGSSVLTNDTEYELPYLAQRKNFNQPNFQTEYESAKFYVIKAFGEDNVHKSIKYGVWSSTPYGNGKLEAAYHEAKDKSFEIGKKCPIFFFFSVNRSGQFVGVAEMIGRVDFSKDLDFWQLDKWSGFFPVKWHILKDIPHSILRHIILKENDNRSVTYTRDTQEIGLSQGIEMLKIFKNYPAETSLLDDFPLYESREKLRVAERKHKAEKQKSGRCESDNYQDEFAAGYGTTYYSNAYEDLTSVTSRTRNLSLNSHSP